MYWIQVFSMYKNRFFIVKICSEFMPTTSHCAYMRNVFVKFHVYIRYFVEIYQNVAMLQWTSSYFFIVYMANILLVTKVHWAKTQSKRLHNDTSNCDDTCKNLHNDNLLNVCNPFEIIPQNKSVRISCVRFSVHHVNSYWYIESFPTYVKNDMVIWLIVNLKFGEFDKYVLCAWCFLIVIRNRFTCILDGENQVKAPNFCKTAH